jgi:hypothetical protein
MQIINRALIDDAFLHLSAKLSEVLGVYIYFKSLYLKAMLELLLQSEKHLTSKQREVKTHHAFLALPQGLITYLQPPLLLRCKYLHLEFWWRNSFRHFYLLIREKMSASKT